MTSTHESPGELAQCPICLEIFKDPKVLPCRHSFCQKCLEGLIKRKTNKNGDVTSFRCPVCRAVVTQGYFRTPSSLKTNHTILGIMEKPKFTENCAEMECKIHPGKYMEYFCETHFDMICANCAVFQHRSCDCVISLNDVTQKQEKNIADFLKTVKDHEHWADVIVCDRQRRIAELGMMAKEIRSKVQKMQQAVYKKIDENVRHVFEHVSRLESNEKQKYQQQIDCCQHITDETRRSRDILDMAMGEGDRNKTLRAMIGMRHMTHIAEVSLNELSLELSALKLEFVPDEGLERLMDGLQSMGDLIVKPIAIEVANKPLSVSNSTDIKLPDKSPPERVPPLLQTELHQITSFQIESKIDNCTPYISSLNALTDGRVLVIDQFNCKVLVFDQGFKFIAATSIRPLPYAAAEVTVGLVAVSIPNKHKVQLVKTTDKSITLAGYFDTGGECYGLAFRKKYFVCCPLGTKSTRLPSIVIFSKMGEILTIISKTQEGEQLFSLPYFICLEGSGDSIKIYVSDMERQSIISVTSHGEKNWERTEDIVSPRGVATVDGKVYVASWKDDRIVEIDRSGNCVNSVISKDLKSPFLVSVGHEDRLYVSQFDGMLTDETEPCLVKVYCLQK